MFNLQQPTIRYFDNWFDGKPLPDAARAFIFFKEKEEKGFKVYSTQKQYQSPNSFVNQFLAKSVEGDGDFIGEVMLVELVDDFFGLSSLLFDEEIKEASYFLLCRQFWFLGIDYNFLCDTLSKSRSDDYYATRLYRDTFINPRIEYTYLPMEFEISGNKVSIKYESMHLLSSESFEKEGRKSHLFTVPFICPFSEVPDKWYRRFNLNG